MTKLELFIKEKRVTTSELEKALKLSPRSLRMDKGIPNKHVEKITSYLEQKYGYDIESPSEEVDIPEPVKPEKKEVRVWNKNFIPKYKDGIVRFQDPESGLWKRYRDWCITKNTNKETGEITMKTSPGFELATQEIFTDKFGRYCVTVSGIKLYKFDK